MIKSIKSKSRFCLLWFGQTIEALRPEELIALAAEIKFLQVQHGKDSSLIVLLLKRLGPNAVYNLGFMLKVFAAKGHKH